MLDETERKKVHARLRRIEGQVAGIRRMLGEDAYCVDVLLQLSAVTGALGKVGTIILDTHVRTCVAEAMTSGNAAQRKRKVDELMLVFERYGGATR